MRRYSILTAILFFGCNSGVLAKTQLGALPHSVAVFFEKNDDKKWGLRIEKDGAEFFTRKEPVNLEICNEGNGIEALNAGYDRFTEKDGSYLAESTVSFRDVSFLVTDKWSVVNDSFQVDRTLVVKGGMSGGFMSGIQLSSHEPATRDSVKLFAPGMIYGTTDHLTASAIGGKNCKDFIRIREDRLPAPLLGAYFANGFSLCVMNSKPDARTIKEDSRDLEANTIIDERLRFGAIGADFHEEKPEFGYWFPGTEGGITYKGMTYPYGQMKKWSRRYHPIRDGLKQEYQVSFRISKNDSFVDFYTGAWRWAWTTLQPPINFQDIGLVRRSVVNMVGDNVETHHGISGLKKWKYARKGTEDTGATKTVMGFGGSTVEAACYLLADSLVENNPLATKHRQLGEAVIHTYLNLKLSPPAGEGFNFEGAPVTSEPSKDPLVYLRSFSDALKELLKAAKREKKAGMEHEDWIAWARTFADWLLPQQQKEGGFPRTWKQGTGVVADPSPESSYMAIPFLILLGEITGEKRYLESALKAGNFCWNSTQKEGVFVGATIDNPNVIDKEAGTISLEAYLLLYKSTSDKKWLARAIAAANFAETWIYLWNVPMPEDEEQKDLHWQQGLSTVGIQLISTGHSLTDMYMAFDTDEFAELYLKTRDAHYYEVALLLLHNTKTMVTLPGRDFGFKGPGWTQEHFSIGPTRGVGLNRNWNPWLASSQLNGMLELEELDKELYRKMTDKGNASDPGTPSPLER
jgi:hypothetical protein